MSSSEPQAVDSKKQYAALIEQFGKAWEAGDKDGILAVFTDAPVFMPDPLGEPIKGRDGLGAYWKDIPRAQAEISFRRGEIFVAGPWFSVEFRCTFRRRRTGEWMDVRGALFCETEGGKIAEMRMYWHREARTPS